MPNEPKKKRWSTKRLVALGFDETRYDRHEGVYRIKCSQCEAMVINFAPCHETGCPNQPQED